MIRVIPTALPDVRVVESPIFGDSRGSFTELYARPAWVAAGIVEEWVQDNQAVSHAVGTLRGLHFQRPPAAQAKLIRVARGAVWDVVVDLRRGSPWFGRWVGHQLSESDPGQLYVPAGFAHGYCTLAPDTIVVYKVSAPYAPECEGGLAWDDPTLAIDWPLPPGGAVLAERDRHQPALDAVCSGVSYDGAEGR